MELLLYISMCTLSCLQNAIPCLLPMIFCIVILAFFYSFRLAISSFITSFFLNAGCNVDVVGYHAVRSAASLAADGRFKEARITALMAERMMKRARLDGKKQYYRGLEIYGVLMNSNEKSSGIRALAVLVCTQGRDD